MWLIALLSGAWAQDVDVRKEASKALTEHFADTASAERIAACAEAIAASLESVKNPARRAAILKGFPGAVDYHAASLTRRTIGLEGLGPPPFKLPPDLLKEGVDLQLDYLALRTERAARAEWTAERRRKVEDQIDQLIRTLKEVLEEKLPGEVGKAYVAREIERLGKAWTGSLDDPYHCFLDRPLLPPEMEQLFDGLRKAGRPFAPVTLAAEDVGDRRRLAELKVLLLVEKVREGAFKACGFCFSQFALLEEKEKAWQAKVDVKKNEYLDSIGVKRVGSEK